MNDQKIIMLFFERSEQAIVELSAKYGAVCSMIAKNILNNMLDVEECMNDAYLGAWNTIPPNNPDALLAYVCRIVRNLSIAKYHKNTALKRNSIYDVALDELEECLALEKNVEEELLAKELSGLIDHFLDTHENATQEIQIEASSAVDEDGKLVIPLTITFLEMGKKEPYIYLVDGEVALGDYQIIDVSGTEIYSALGQQEAVGVLEDGTTVFMQPVGIETLSKGTKYTLVIDSIITF